MATATAPDPALESCRRALRHVAGDTHEPALDARLLDLSERKESLTPAERAEQLALVSFTQQRTVEKLEAELALRQLDEAFHGTNGTP